MSEDDPRLAENLAKVRAEIASAAAEAGRAADSVRLVAVTKYVGVDVARRLVALGCLDLGEARPQELWNKAEAIVGEPVRWHLIGHWQRNKVRRTLPHLALAHTIDSVRLANEVSSAAAPAMGPLPVLLEVNTSGDEAKHGFTAEELLNALPELHQLRGLRLDGLMTMAGLNDDLSQARQRFAALRELCDRCRIATGLALPELSMGMSGDFRAAILEGATLVRIGSALFEGLAH